MEDTETIIVNSPHPFHIIPVEQNSIRFRTDLRLMLILFIFPLLTWSQSADYPAIFGADWQKAQQFVSENRTWIADRLENYNIDFCEAVAVIFPELVRYSALRDKMEITLLKTLYVNIGEDYANFSIGQFQMKPSFARELAAYRAYAGSGRLRRLIAEEGNFENEWDYRSKVVADLEDVHRQLDYLILFIKICENKFKTDRMSPGDRIRFVSTAYNYGLKHTAEEIEKASERKYFSTKMIKTEVYSYSDISHFWYNNQCPDVTGRIVKLP